MQKLLIVLIICLTPLVCVAEWSEPVWTDDCVVTVEKDKDGRMIRWTEICYDEAKKPVSKRVDEYGYYETKEVNEIEQKIFDSKDAVTSDIRVKHYVDGKQPTVSAVSIGEVEVGR